MVEEAGWQRPWAYSDSSEREAAMVRQAAGVLDLSPLGKVAVKGAERNVVALLEAAWPEAGPAAPPLRATRVEAGAATVCRMAADEALVLTAPPAQASTVRRLEERAASGSGCVHVLDVTSGQAGLRLAGPRAREVLRTCTALDVRDGALPDLALGQTSLARAPALVLRNDYPDGLPAFSLFFGRDVAAFVWDWLMHVGEQLGLGPFGLGAHQILGASQP